MKIFLLIFLFSTLIFSLDKIPKATINEYPFIEKDDLTEKYQFNLSLVHNFFYWDNQADDSKGIDWIPYSDGDRTSIQLGFDINSLFFKGVTFRLSYNNYYKQLYLGSGYKLNLYTIFYLKGELITQFFSDRFQTGYTRIENNREIERFQSNSFFRGFDLGASVTLGMEFNIFDHFQVLIYPFVLDMLLINNRKLTSFQWEHYVGFGYYY